MYTHTHIHTHTHTHAYTHIHTYTRTHAYIYICSVKPQQLLTKHSIRDKQAFFILPRQDKVGHGTSTRRVGVGLAAYMVYR